MSFHVDCLFVRSVPWKTTTFHAKSIQKQTPPPLIPVRCQLGYLEPLRRRVRVDTPLLLPGSILRSCESSYHIGPPLKEETRDNKIQNLSVLVLFIILSKIPFLSVAIFRQTKQTKKDFTSMKCKIHTQTYQKKLSFREIDVMSRGAKERIHLSNSYIFPIYHHLVT